MKQDLKLHIYPRSAKTNKQGFYPIYVRITLNGKRWEFSTKKFINPKTWDAKNAKIKPTVTEASSINNYLNQIKTQIINLEIEYNIRNQEISLDDIKNLFARKQDEVVRMIVPIFKLHNEQISKLANKEFAPGTILRYETTLKHLQDFLKFQYKVEDMALEKIDHAFIMDFDFYFRTVRNCNNNTTVKYIKNFKKIINYCLANDWIRKDPFVNYKVKIEKVECIFLSEEEIVKIYIHEHPAERLKLVRDIFIFSCYTGLAYVDVDNLTKNHIVKGIDGQLWIHTYRQKTSTPTKIPLLDIPLEIINKYQDHPLCKGGKLLPVFSNQKMNVYLKEIAAIAGINKELTFHCARHTFATTVTLSNGVPIESVSKMLGHNSITTTQHYARITEQKISHDMEHLKNIFDKKKSKVL
ncbi:site-specific integrase [Empedobacter sp. UBA7620]|nr:site-specific integrase [Empedobacter sp. UBA7620]